MRPTKPPATAITFPLLMPMPGENLQEAPLRNALRELKERKRRGRRLLAMAKKVEQTQIMVNIHEVIAWADQIAWRGYMADGAQENWKHQVVYLAFAARMYMDLSYQLPCEIV